MKKRVKGAGRDVQTTRTAETKELGKGRHNKGSEKKTAMELYREKMSALYADHAGS